MGLSPDVLWDLSWREFDLLRKHYEDSKWDEYNRLRILGSWVLAPHTKKKVKPSDLLKLPVDERPKVVTRQEFDKIVSEWHKLRNSQSE